MSLLEAVATTVFVSLVSALVPAVPIEPILIGMAASSEHGAVALGLAAAVGQTAGKVLLFLGARGTVRSARLRRWLGRHASRPATESPPADPEPERVRGVVRRWARHTTGAVRRFSAYLTAALARPAVAAPILFLSALVGMPPLLLAGVYLGTTRMRLAVFATVCFAGRSARFIAIAWAPDLVQRLGSG